MGYDVNRLSNLLTSFSQATSVTAVQLSANASWTALTGGQQAQVSAVNLTNNDNSATIYVGFSNLVTSAANWYAIPPQGILPVDLQHLGRKPFTQLWAIASTGTPNLTVTLFGA